MRSEITLEQRDPHRKVIIALSISIPVIVAILFGVSIDGYDLYFLPPIYASFNGLTAVLLVVAVGAIRRRKQRIHESLMKICIGLSAAFLVLYIAYHMTSEPTPYGGVGVIRYIYYFILISHILLSVAITPLVLFTFSRAISGNFERHRRLAKFTYPIWLYVAVTGVIVYIMISPYYK